MPLGELVLQGCPFLQQLRHSVLHRHVIEASCPGLIVFRGDRRPARYQHGGRRKRHEGAATQFHADALRVVHDVLSHNKRYRIFDLGNPKVNRRYRLCERSWRLQVGCYRRSMGRPALGHKATTVRLSVETVRRIEALTGNRQLASFVREAVENELKRREPNKPSDRP